MSLCGICATNECDPNAAECDVCRSGCHVKPASMEQVEAEFKAGRRLSAIGSFWDYIEREFGRGPIWSEIEPILVRALDEERDAAKKAVQP